MTGCERHGTGVVELYFYDELEPAERSAVERHLRSCAECRRAVEELSTIRSVLAARPRIEAPPGGDWTPFMQRLDEALRFEDGAPRRAGSRRSDRAASDASRAGVGYVQYLAMAALLTLVTAGVVYVARSTSRRRLLLLPSVRRRGPARAGPGSGLAGGVYTGRGGAIRGSRVRGAERAALRALEARGVGPGQQGSAPRTRGRLGLRARARLEPAERHAPLSSGRRGTRA